MPYEFDMMTLELRKEVDALKKAVRVLSTKVLGQDFEGQMLGIDVTRKQIQEKYEATSITVVYPGRPFVWNYEEGRVTVLVDKNHVVQEVVLG
jgi:hypothetical protein